MSRAKLRDARVLYAAKRYDGSIYPCGYAVELALKARICKTLHWDGFPTTNKEFEGLNSLRIHDLHTLLHFTGRADYVKQNFLPAWSVLTKWTPTMRYLPVGTTTSTQANEMLNAADLLVRIL